MPLVDGDFFGAGDDFGAAGGAGCGDFFGAGGAAGAAGRDDDAPPLDFRGWLAIRFPAGEIANQLPPNAVRPSPFVSPDFVSLTKL
jgi:hypothetical protein